jgi:hypothetical protein
MRNRVIAVLSMLAVTLMTGNALAQAELPSFRLKDHIGRNWERDLVEYPIDIATVKALEGHKLVDSKGNEAVYQFGKDGKSILFQANVEPFSTNVYSFKKGAPSTASDLVIGETDQHVEITGGKAGMRIAKGLKGSTTQTPILSWRMASGTWAGKVAFEKPQSIAAHTVTVLERGPVCARVQSKTIFADGDKWTIDFELQAGEEMVKVTETFKFRKKRTVNFVFNENFEATHALLRASSRHPVEGVKYDFGDIIKRELKPLPQHHYLLQIEPWIHWGGNPTLTSSFGLTDKEFKDIFMFAVCAPEKWVDPKIAPPLRARPANRLTMRADRSVVMPFELAQGQREYLIGSVSGEEDRKIVEGKKRVPMRVQFNQIKHSDHPLDRVKDYILEWDAKGKGTAAFLSKKDERDLLKNFKVENGQVAKLRKKKMHPSHIEEFLPVYMTTKDKKVEKILIDGTLEQLQERVDQLVKLEDGFVTVGMAPHHFNSLMVVANVAGVIFNSPQLTAEQQERLKAQIAFIYYTFSRDAYCSVERGFAGFTNMTASVFGNRAALSSVVPGHPMQAEWQRSSAEYMKKNFLDRWTDKDGAYDGGHIESLHYASITYEIVLMSLYSAYATGVDKEAIFHPAIKHLGQWYAESATPRDSRILNWRHMPPVGHVYKFEVYPSIHAILAFMWKDKDPEFAAHMKWMQLQQGNTREQTTGGFLPTFAGYRKLFMANDVTGKAPAYTSRHWKNTSVILRSHYNDPLENMLYLIAGQGHSHYDMDSGSITLWGKGEIIADDFGLYGHAPGADHNMLESAAAPPLEKMYVTAFDKGENVDYTRGKKAAWTRRLFHVKHSKATGPNYYVIQDDLAVEAPAKWRLWLTSEDVEVKGKHVIAQGLHRIASDIHFAALPKNTRVTTEKKSRTNWGCDGQAKYGRTTSTQTGLIINASAFKNLCTLVFPRLKNAKPPKVESIADGAGFRVKTPYGTDYVFLSDKPVTFKEGKFSFSGTAGFARIKGGSAVMELKEAGEISYGTKKVVRKASAADAKSANMIPDGELRTGKWSLFPKQKSGGSYEVTLLKRDDHPELVKLGLKDAYAQKIVCQIESKEKWRSHLLITQGRIFIDPEKTYRVRARVHIPGKHRLYLQSYGNDGNNKQVKTDKGRVWSWSLEMTGPTNGFVEFKTLLGPEGSGAERPFVPGTVYLPRIQIRMCEEGKGVAYFDDIVFEEVTEE